MKSTTVNRTATEIGKRKPKIQVSLVIKVTILIVLLIVTVSSVTNYLIFQMGLQALKDEIRDKLMMTASNATITIDTDKLAGITKAEDQKTPVYLELQKKLQDVQKASMGKLRYVYTIARSGKSYFYVMDAVPVDDKDHSNVGDEFKISDFPEAMNAFERPTAEKEPTFDKDFKIWSESGYAPIKDKTGKVIGVLGVDMDVSTLKKEEQEIRKAAWIALLSSFMLAMFLGVGFSRYLTRPILMLRKGTQKVAEGDFETVVHINRNDEFGILADSFNAMTADLKASREELKQYNLELEAKVKQRTFELTLINKEIKDILDNMSQAIFTIDDKFSFNAQLSRYAYEIFGDISFTDRSLLDVFLGTEGQQLDRENMANWLNRVFTDTTTSWANLEPLQPVHEIAIKAKNHQGQELTKYIRVNFSPIIDALGPDFKEKVTKLMVIVQDVTEQKTLALAMEQKEQEYKDNLNQIVEVIKMDQEMFKDFIDESKESLVDFEPKLLRLRDEKENMDLVNDLFRIMHTLKGNARFFKLERIAGEAHSIENIFSSIRKGEQVMSDALLDECFKKLDRFNEIFNETLDVYHKIMQGTKMDTGRTRTDERKTEDNEVIKVKVEQLNRLTELFRRADHLINEDIGRTLRNNGCESKVDEIESLFRETEEQLQSLRKIQIGKLFGRFPRMVRDIGIELGKKVKLVTKGEELEIDKNVYDKIGDPLVHILRNSLDHGIEKPEERLSLGKADEGTIELNVDLSASQLQIQIKDDGKGLDVDKIKAKAVTKGLITPDKALNMPDEDAVNLIFAPGFSTNDQVTQISGRGVGMDVVKTSVEKDLNGTVSIESRKNQGLTITLCIPLAS